MSETGLEALLPVPATLYVYVYVVYTAKCECY